MGNVFLTNELIISTSAVSLMKVIDVVRFNGSVKRVDISRDVCYDDWQCNLASQLAACLDIRH